MPTPITAAIVKQVRFSGMYLLHIVSPIRTSPLKPRATESEQLLQEAEIITELYDGSIEQYHAERASLRHSDSQLSRAERLQRTDLCPVAIPAPKSLTLCGVGQSSLAKRRALKMPPLTIPK